MSKERGTVEEALSIDAERRAREAAETDAAEVAYRERQRERAERFAKQSREQRERRAQALSAAADACDEALAAFERARASSAPNPYEAAMNVGAVPRPSEHGPGEVLLPLSLALEGLSRGAETLRRLARAARE